jgi:hypothetical protein
LAFRLPLRSFGAALSLSEACAELPDLDLEPELDLLREPDPDHEPERDPDQEPDPEPEPEPDLEPEPEPDADSDPDRDRLDGHDREVDRERERERDLERDCRFFLDFSASILVRPGFTAIPLGDVGDLASVGKSERGESGERSEIGIDVLLLSPDTLSVESGESPSGSFSIDSFFFAESLQNDFLSLSVLPPLPLPSSAG